MMVARDWVRNWALEAGTAVLLIYFVGNSISAKNEEGGTLDT